MKKDLENYFDFDITLETKKAPYWRVVATDDARIKLLSKSKQRSISGSHAGFVAKNIPMKQLISTLFNYNQLGPPFVDETGIEGNIDITIDAMLSNFDDFKRALSENGLDLVKEEKEMKVLVIKDAKN